MIKQAIAILLIALTNDAVAQENPITGLWKGEDKQGIKMQIYRAKDGAYYAKAADSSGQIVLKKLLYDTHKKQYKGTMHPPDANIELNATLTQISADRIKITVRKLLLTKTMYISRIQ